MAKLVWVLALVWANAWRSGFVVQAHSGSSQRFKPQDDVGGKPNCSDVLYAKVLRGDIPTIEVALFVGVLPVLCILGLAGGIVSLIGLLRRDMQVPANKFLIGMTAGDIILVVSGLVHFLARLMDWDMTCRGKTVAYTLKTAAYMAIIGGRVVTLFITVLGLERVLTIWLPSFGPKLPFAKYPFAILAAGTGVCIFFTSSLFELAVGAITPYHTNATTFILLGPSFGGDTPARTSGMVAITIVHHLLVIVNIILVIAGLVKTIQKKRNGNADDEDEKKEITLTTTYLAIGSVFVLLMLPGIISSLVATTDEEFKFEGRKEATFKMFLFIHYIMEMTIPVVHLPILVALHVYFRDSLGSAFGCVKDEEARRLVTKSESDDPF